MGHEEKEGGSDRVRREMAEFREEVDVCCLRDLGYEGKWYTWEKGKTVETRVHERLERYLASQSWLNMFPSAHVEHLLGYKSDHTAILVRHEERRGRKKSRRERNLNLKPVGFLMRAASKQSKGRGRCRRGKL